MIEIKKIAIIANFRKSEAVETGRNLLGILKKRGVKALMPDLTNHLNTYGLKESGLKLISNSAKESDIVILIGGDGTLLTASRAIAPTEKPILPINVGGIGFLTETDISGVDEAIYTTLEGRFTLDRRMLLRVDIGGWHSEVLNDIELHRGLAPQVAHIEILRNGKTPITFSGDGLIISTPTGSTAYSLSAGGPVIDPSLEVILYTPICPHPHFIAPFILPTTEIVKVKGRIAIGTHTCLTIDGQVRKKLSWDDEMLISKSKYILPIIRLKNWELFRVLRDRWGWHDMREDKVIDIKPDEKK
ncbi:MAG: NAD(+)/NADH kinase [bacterium]